MYKKQSKQLEFADFILPFEAYKNRFGCFPESVHADKIYRNRKNLEYCKEKGIRLSGPALGRPKKGEGKEQNLNGRHGKTNGTELQLKASLGKGNGVMALAESWPNCRIQAVRRLRPSCL